jgi:hypothetical protein
MNSEKDIKVYKKEKKFSAFPLNHIVGIFFL